MDSIIDKNELKQAIGGAYQLHDGREFWIDEVATEEIAKRVLESIRQSVARRALFQQP